MKCPVDGETLVITERSGVEIDYCPTCRGVWLDRGELDKIIEHIDGPRQSPQPRQDDRWDDHDDWDDRDTRARRPRRRESLLGELFDLFD
ncbi:MAG: zf-TFIIB domain-containing protein [Pseudomonadota bacterium]